MNNKHTMSKENITEIVEGVIGLMRKGNAISRNKAFAECFEQVETRWGKAALTEATKKDIRGEVDAMLKADAALTKHEVVSRVSSYLSINGSGELIRGRRLTTLDTEKLSTEKEIQLIAQELQVHRAKVARKAEGATEADIRKERKLRNAINSNLYTCSLNNIGGEIVENVMKYIAGLPPIRNEVAKQVEVGANKPEAVKSEQVVAK